MSIRYSADAMQELVLRRVYLNSKNLNVGTVKVIDLAYESGRSIPYIFAVLRPVKSLVGRSPGEVASVLCALFQRTVGREIDRVEWPQIDAEAIAKARQVHASIVTGGGRLMTIDTLRAGSRPAKAAMKKEAVQ